MVIVLLTILGLPLDWFIHVLDLYSYFECKFPLRKWAIGFSNFQASNSLLETRLCSKSCKLFFEKNDLFNNLEETFD